VLSGHFVIVAQGCSGAGTRGNGVPTPFSCVGTRSHTFLHQ